MTRKEMKKRAKKTVKSHYLLLLIICLICAFWGTEFNDSSDLMTRISNVTSTTQSSSTMAKSGAGDVYRDILNNNIKAGSKTAAKLMDKYEAGHDQTKILGRTRGSLASFMNKLTSGDIFIKIVQSLNSVFNSKSAGAVIFIGLSFIFYLMVWIFLMNVFKVIVRRMFLEARTYEKVPFQHVLHFNIVGRWRKVCLSLMVQYIFQALWNLTVIGGVIKYYSYFLTPFILAENPDIGGRRAITLSRKMMYGHKIECFKLQLSFAGWYALSWLTGGLVGMLFLNMYLMAAYSEFYVEMRKAAIEAQIPDADLLNDKYLYEPADRCLLSMKYSDVVEEEEFIKTHEVRLPLLQRLFAEYLGVWFGSMQHKLNYQEVEETKVQISDDQDALGGEAYPARLNPLWVPKEDHIIGQLMFMRSYTIWCLLIMFFCLSFLGWCWEVSLHLINDGVFVNRGTMQGPWLPIYGTGGLIVLMLLSKLRAHPVAEFFGAILLCGVVEYGTSVYLEKTYNARWWDYTGYFFNIDGRICAEGLLVFAIGGMVMVYVIAPMIDTMISKIKMPVLISVCMCLLILFTIDSVYSHKHPNMGNGITSYKAYKTEEAMLDNMSTGLPAELPALADLPLIEEG